jgi:hypothetical protein
MNWPPSLYPPASDVMRFLCCLNATIETAIEFEKKCQGLPVNRKRMKSFDEFVEAMHLLGASTIGRSTLNEFLREDLLEDVNDWIRLGETKLSLHSFDEWKIWLLEMEDISEILFALERWLGTHTNRSVYNSSSSFRDTFERQSAILWKSSKSLFNEQTEEHDRDAQELLSKWMLEREARISTHEMDDLAKRGTGYRAVTHADPLHPLTFPLLDLVRKTTLSQALMDLAESTLNLFCLDCVGPSSFVRTIPIDFCSQLPAFNPFQKLSEIEELAGFRAKNGANPIPFCEAWEKWIEMKTPAERKITLVEWLAKITLERGNFVVDELIGTHA